MLYMGIRSLKLKFMKLFRVLIITAILALIIGTGKPVIKGKDGTNNPKDPKDPSGAITQDYG